MDTVNPASAAFVEGMKATIERLEAAEAEARQRKFRNRQLETALIILARRHDGIITWTNDELTAAKAETRCLFLSSLDLALEKI